MNKDNIIFIAEVSEVKAKRTASIDKECRVVLITENDAVLQLQKYIAEGSVRVIVEPNF